MKYFKTHTQFLNEVRRSKEPFTFSEKEIKDIADLIAKAISKVDKTKAAVHDMEFVDGEGAGFEISIDGEKYDGGSYDVRPNGEVVNVAIGNSFPNAVYAKIGDKNINQIIKNIKKFESVDVNEAKLSAIHKAAKKGSYPVSIVVIKDGKVIAQELVKTPAAVPAAFNVIKNYHKHKGATVHVESKTGERLFSESLVTEATGQQRLNHLRKFGIAPNNQPQSGAYIKSVSKPGKFFVDWKDAFKLGDVALEFVKSVGSISEFDIIDLKTMKRTGKQLDVKKGQLGNLRTTYGVRVNESVVTEGKFNKRSLMKAMKKDDGMIQLGNGQEYVIYNPNNGNQDNTDMWDDKVIFALDQDGEEHEIKYSDIVRYDESRKINLKAAHLSSEEYQKAKKLKDFDKEDWEWNSKSGLYDRVNEDDTISGLNNMANTNLERIADYANMIKDRMSQGQQLDAWMYSKISDSVKNLNSVHDTMDGNDGVIEATDVNEATDFNDPVLIRIRQVQKHANDMKKLDAMKKEAEREAKRNRPRWTQKKYDKWLDTVASNGGAENAFDMAKNAEFEPGLIDWVKKEFRGDDPLQRIQWDIEAFAK